MKEVFKKIIISLLQNQLGRLIAKHQLQIVAVTGSVGKTTTKLAIAAVLAQKYKVLVHEGNYNTEIGLPLSIFEQTAPVNQSFFKWLQIIIANEKLIRTNYPYEVLVVEMGADHSGDIERFMSYLSPDIGVVTAVAPAHVEGFGSLENILHEKWLLAEGSKKALVNIDFDPLNQKANESSKEILTYSVQKKAANYYFASTPDIDENHQQVGVLETPRQKIEITTLVVGEHSLGAVVAAAAVGDLMGLSNTQIALGVQAIKPVAGRMQILKGIQESVLIDDTYNASAVSMIAALETLNALAKKRQVAVLGAMNELGDASPAEHKRVGQACGNLDQLITIGANAQDYLVPAALQTGLNISQIHSFDSPIEAGRFLRSIVQTGDTVLFKGSQNGVFAEEALKHVLLDPADCAKLVRQSPEWLVKKQRQFSTVQKIYE